MERIDWTRPSGPVLNSGFEIETAFTLLNELLRRFSHGTETVECKFESFETEAFDIFGSETEDGSGIEK